MILTKKKEAGFTLVELAIVMMIIGLLLGGILKGQELIKNAKISATAAQLKAFESAITTFQDLYNGKPGDLFDARNKVPGCTAAQGCNNGNGNGSIAGDTSIDDGNPMNAGERYQALKQLALSDLIGGVDPSAAAGNANAYVQADVGGYLYLGEFDGSAAIHSGGGFAATPAGTYVGITDGGAEHADNSEALIASQVAKLDRKIDDGTPGTGTLLSTSAAACVTGTAYNEQNAQKQCAFIYRAQ